MIFLFLPVVALVALCAAEQVVTWLEERPQSRFERVLAALERIAGTEP